MTAPITGRATSHPPLSGWKTFAIVALEAARSTTLRASWSVRRQAAMTALRVPTGQRVAT